MHVEVSQLRAFCYDNLIQSGVDTADAELTTDVLVTTDTWGVFTHGIKSLGNYLRRLEAGGLLKKGKPVITAEGPAWALVDGASSLGMTTSTFAMDTAVRKAAESGIGYVGVRNSCHFGAAGYYAVQAAKQNMIGLAMANDIPGVAAPNAKGNVLGTNPFAYAIPTADERPIFLDIATSVVAGGKVIAAAFRGDEIPETWALDDKGHPTNDPNFYPLRGALQPMGQHKGYSIALMIEILSACLTGAAMTNQVVSWSQDDPSIPTGHGAAFIAIDVGSMMDLNQFQERIEALRTEIKSSPSIEGAPPVRLPGDQEWEHRAKALRTGLTLPDHVAAAVQSLAAEKKVSLDRYFG